MKICCDDMKANLHTIDHTSTLQEDFADKTIYYSPKFDEYGIPIFDGENGVATSYILINYCPWCGAKLPESKRNEWFDTLEKMGYDSPLDEEIPIEFTTAEWYHNSEN